jgi:hypothetical protein
MAAPQAGHAWSSAQAQGSPPASTAAAEPYAPPRLIRVQDQGEFAVADMIGGAGKPIPFNIALPPHQPTDYMLLSFRGLPEGFSLSSGFRAADAWLVSVREAPGLRLIPPKDFDGAFDLEIQLSRGRNAGRLAQQIRVEFRPRDVARSAPPAAVPEAALSDPSSTGAVAVNTASDPSASPAQAVAAEKERELLETAATMLKQNDITAARLIYARLAREGSREGAITMAQTYDPAFLSHYETTGLQPDSDKAKHWYGIAASLGSTDASRRLLALEAKRR